jgi:hypothetical protein
MIPPDNQYQNVFIENTMNYSSLSVAVMVVLLSPIVIVMSWSFFTSKLISNITTALTVAVFVAAPALYVGWTLNNSDKAVESIKHNVNQKYGLKLSLGADDLQVIKDLSEFNRYTVMVNSEQLPNEYVLVPYAISFDRATNEPTVEEIEPVKIPAQVGTSSTK